MTIARSAKYFGADILTETAVNKVIMKNNKAIGVALDNGNEYHSKTVISALDPKQTFLKLIDENELPEEILKDIKNFKIRGSSGKVNLALDGLPNF